MFYNIINIIGWWCIIRINGISTKGISHTDAVNIIKQGGNKITLTVKRLSDTTSKLYIALLNW